MPLEPFIRPEWTFVFDGPLSWESAVREVSQRLGAAAPGVEADRIIAALTAREKQGSTRLPEGVAFPHAMIEGAERALVAAVLVKRGVEATERRVKPVHLMFVIVGPPSDPWQHLRILARLARICHAPGALERLRGADDEKALYDRVVAEDRLHV